MPEFFKDLKNNLQKIADLEINDVAFKIASEKEVKDLVIQLNTEGQLFELGEDSLGNKLQGKTILKDGQYSPFTIQEKISKGQKIENPTLEDTGGFYSSFVVVPFRGGFTINANPIKGSTNLFDELGIDILGLNDENLGILKDVYKEKVLEEIRKRIGSGLL